MPELTCRVQTPLPGWVFGQIVRIERTEFVEALLDSGRLVLLADPESAATDQGDDPEEPEGPGPEQPDPGTGAAADGDGAVAG